MGLMISKLPQQCREGLSLAKDIKIDTKIRNIVIAGMGGSGIAGQILKSYLGDKIPVHIVQDFSVPEFVDAYSLVFCVSYSGNTAETLSAFRTAVRRSAQIVVIASGGKLKELAKKTKKQMIDIPKNFPPRAALGYLFIPILVVLQNSGIIFDKTAEIKNMIDSLMHVQFKEKAQELALKIKDKIPVIYSSNKLKSVALRWKEQLNENSKIHCFCNVFPELEHNEIMGYENLRGNFFVMILKDDDDRVEIKDRMNVVKKIISEQCPVLDIVVKGDSLLTKIFSAIYLGDLTSFYLALLYETDPTPVDSIERVKDQVQ